MGDRVIVMGASADGCAAIMKVVAGLPATFGASLLVVLHVGARHSQLPALLTRCGKLPAHHAVDGEPLLPGRIYVAPPDRHLLVDRGHIRLSRGPRECFTRPALDPLFRSAALAYGPDAIGVVLTGRGRDGTAGLRAIREHGGVTIVQDPSEIRFPSMPASALSVLDVDYQCPLADIAGLLRDLVDDLPAAKASSGAKGGTPLAVLEHGRAARARRFSRGGK